MSSLKMILKNRHYLSIAMVFMSLNVIMSTWAIYIPSIKADLNIDEAALGFAIFCFAAGTFVVLSFAHSLIEKIGVGVSSFYGIIAYCLLFILPFYVTDYILFCFGLFLVGMTGGYTDIAMNTLVSEYENKDKVFIMSSAHGFFSLGGILGAGIGSIIMVPLGSKLLHMVIMAAIVIGMNLLFVRNYYKVKVNHHGNEEKFSFKYFKALFAIGLIGFVIMGSEGAITDWSALYLEQICKAESWQVGMGYTLFSAFMTIGRFYGDRISQHFGAVKIIYGGCVLAVLAYMAILTGHFGMNLIGFSLLGIGFSVIVPELFRLGGKIKGVKPSQGISFVAGTGYAGFLVGPVLLGGVAGIAGLKASFLVLLLFVIIAIGANFFVRVEER